MSKIVELIHTIKRRKVNIACLQGTRWKGDKAKEITYGYRLYYIGNNETLMTKME